LDTSLAALVEIVRASLRALRVAVGDLTFAPENVRRVADEAETLSAALGRLDRMLAAAPPLKSREQIALIADTVLTDALAVLDWVRRIQEADGQCAGCGAVRL
jgi:hypothetical protein